MNDQQEPENVWFDCEDPSRTTFSIAKNEINKHYHFMGSADRYWIQPAALLRPSDSLINETLVRVESAEEKEIAYQFARYFHKETGYDHAPYDPKEMRPKSEQVFLIKSPDIRNASYDFMVGAVGTEEIGDGRTVVMWIWLHPFSRGSKPRSLALAVWQALEERFGKLVVLAPISKQMRRFLEKNQINTEYVRV